MTDEQLLIECKAGLGIQADSTDFDDVLNQKLLAVKAYMTGAGVSADTMASDLAVGVIVMGVGDLWNDGGGGIKFSPAFHTLLIQLTGQSSLLTVTSDPADGTTDVTVNVNPALTFNRRISSCKVSLMDYNTQVTVSITTSLDITGRVLTITPASDLDAATKYAIVIDSAFAVTGQSLSYTVIAFTTA